MRMTTVSREAGPRADFRPNVVIVSPEEEGGREVRSALDAVGGFDATMVRYGVATLADFQEMQPRVILLAIVRDSAYGLATCRQLRLACDLPIVICARSDRERDIVRAFESGADDYLVMPMKPAELGARLRAVLRRSADWPSAQPAQPVLIAGEFEIRLNEQRVFHKGRSIELSPMEFRLLAALMRRPGQLVTHAVLLAEVWGPQYVDSRNYLRLYVQYLREKIEDDPHRPRAILNEWGVGYRFEPDGGAPTLRREASRAVA